MEQQQPDEMDEATLLIGEERQAATHPRRTKVFNLVLLLIICALERCTFYEYLADVMNCQTSNGSHPGNYCGILGNEYAVKNLFESWKDQTLLGLAFLLPVLGGVAADWHCGCLRVLQSGCVVYSLGAMLMVGLVYVPSACNDSCKYTCQAALALGSGFIRPCLMTMTYEIGQPMLGTIGVCHLYYMCEVIGEVMGCWLAFGTDLLQKPLTLSCVCSTHIMIGLTIGLTHSERDGWNPGRLRLPYWPRIRRILIVVWPIILSSSVLMLNSFTINSYEVSRLANQKTLQDLMTNRDLLLLIWSVSLLLFVVAMTLATRRSSIFKSRYFRISLGIAVAAVSQFIESGVVFYFRANKNENRPSLSQLRFIFGSQSVLGAASEALIFIAVNEIAFKISPTELRTFMTGLFMSLRGSGFFTTVLILLGYQAATLKSLFHDNGGAYMHLVLGAALLIAWLFFRLTARRALRWLVEIQAAASH